MVSKKKPQIIYQNLEEDPEFIIFDDGSVEWADYDGSVKDLMWLIEDLAKEFSNLNKQLQIFNPQTSYSKRRKI